FPDPASRFQSEGPDGPSEVVDPRVYRWRDQQWRGITRRGRIISEIHIGTFTPEGTFAAAAAKLPLLADAGINTVEVMPVNEYPGRFGWGYDGVDLWAPTRLYGRPDDFRRLVDVAHAASLGVILDVVYNHLGPDGSFLSKFTPDYFTKKYKNEWGDALNFDGDHSDGVREFFIENAACWIDEFHLDGLRLDATQSINDESGRHVLQDIVETARAAAGQRSIYVVAENEPQRVQLLQEYGLDALWNDDWHHSASVATTGHAEAYYTDYQGKPQEFVSMAKFGFLYQGQRYKWQKGRRGTASLDVAADQFICCLQNHDQVANSAHGERLQFLTSPGRYRAATALLLLGPQTPMLFQGEEFASSKRFVYFADHKPDLARAVAKGRREFLAQFPSMATEAMQQQVAAPEDPRTFEMCKLEWSERDSHPAALRLHRDLIALRLSDRTFAAHDSGRLDGAVLAPEAFVLRWILGGGADRLLVVTLGADLQLDPAPEPLLAPPADHSWSILWSSEDADYGGSGTAPLETEENWRIPGHAAVVLKPA
ncbi:MAG TPA: alpha-amylase family glycosyl hydrolase, partial [Thermoanaerobaculia bacterium]|nr:alpha-amylase family glycosyl hydrolase [Thermoanaerobaculia bacterium]